jgi:hypothetical protein
MFIHKNSPEKKEFRKNLANTILVNARLKQGEIRSPLRIGLADSPFRFGKNVMMLSTLLALFGLWYNGPSVPQNGDVALVFQQVDSVMTSQQANNLPLESPLADSALVSRQEKPALPASQNAGKEAVSQRIEKKQYLLRTVAFYNLENLFDTLNDSLTFDDERTPEGADHWTSPRLEKKLKHLAGALSGIGAEMGVNPPDLIGVCEVENQSLLQSLSKQPGLQPFPYGIIHFDSPDPRGIDVALMYREDRFFPEESKSVRLMLYDESGVRKYTRDQLVVSGYLDTDLIAVLVNHWPSRGGGAIRSREHRKAAALLQRHLIDSLLYRNPDIKIISMGDFNDNPVDLSIGIVEGGQWKKAQPQNLKLFNPLSKAYRRGLGTLAYRDRWNLFDQILFSGSWSESASEGYRFWKAGIFQPDYLKTPSGRYQGYPFRTYASGLYQGGYSDHFPVFAYIIRPARGRVN